MIDDYARHSYKVEVEIDSETGQIVSECWFNEDGELHHPSGKPAFTQYHSNGNVWREEYFANGAPHRDGDHPAVVSYESWEHPGVVTTADWYKHGVKFRAPELPSTVLFDPKTGFPVYEEVTDSNGDYAWHREREYGTGRIVNVEERKPKEPGPPPPGV